jgi:uncharacterized membrane protein YfbV (UPF0208 family)
MRDERLGSAAAESLSVAVAAALRGISLQVSGVSWMGVRVRDKGANTGYGWIRDAVFGVMCVSITCVAPTRDETR